MTDEQMNPDATSDDKLWAALSYIFSPIVPIILLLLEDKKDRPFIKSHSMQALVFGVVFWGITSILSIGFVGLCLVPVGWLLELYWGYQAYQGQSINIPIITDFVKNQGWA